MLTHLLLNRIKAEDKSLWDYALFVIPLFCYLTTIYTHIKLALLCTNLSKITVFYEGVRTAYITRDFQLDFYKIL